MLPENDCGFYIKHIHDVLQRDSNNALRSRGLTLVQVTVLLQLEAAPEGQLPLKELERRLQVAQSTAAGIIARLEQKGLVESSVCPDDRRVKQVRITSSGLACCADSRSQMEAAEQRLLAPLDEADRSVFAALLKKVSLSMK